MLNYVDQGQGTPVVLVHGIAASLHSWDLLAPELVAAGCRVAAVDLLGHGDSPRPAKPEQLNLRAVFNTFEAWLGEMRLGVDAPIHLVGHSLGGYLSIRYALCNPERVRSLALVNPLYCVAQLSPLLRAFRRRPGIGTHLVRLAPAWLIGRALAWNVSPGDGSSLQSRWQTAVDYKRTSPHFLNITRRVPDLTPELGKLHMPVMLIWGDNDRTLDPLSFPRMIARLPQAEHHRMRDSGHTPHVGRAEDVNRLVVAWIMNLENQGKPRTEEFSKARTRDRLA